MVTSVRPMTPDAVADAIERLRADVRETRQAVLTLVDLLGDVRQFASNCNAAADVMAMAATSAQGELADKCRMVEAMYGEWRREQFGERSERPSSPETPEAKRDTDPSGPP